MGRKELETRSRAIGARVYLSRPRKRGWAEFDGSRRASEALHAGWVHPPADEEAYQRWLQRNRRPDQQAFLLREAESSNLAGVVILSQIFRGRFLSCYLGYYSFAEFAGQGLMKEGLQLVLAYAFDVLELHRVEANVQPANKRSVKLLRRLGFEHEGFSRQYLYIEGEWKDHERFAMRQEIFKRPHQNWRFERG